MGKFQNAPNSPKIGTETNFGAENPKIIIPNPKIHQNNRKTIETMETIGKFQNAPNKVKIGIQANQSMENPKIIFSRGGEGHFVY